jgi:hypothetical protein
VPMVGWKQTLLLVFASQFLVSDKYLHTLCIEMEMMVEYIYLYVYE